MTMAIVLFVIVVASVLFNFFSPWWFTPIASNWGGIDTALIITFWICGVAFVLIGGFMVYAIWKYRYREGQTAAYEPENTKLEWILTIATTIGVVGMLAPGLAVWDDYVNVPEEAAEVEIVGQQWAWSYRLPGADGQLGTVDSRRIAFDNPFGIIAEDTYGQDDILIARGALHLPIDEPVKALLRSKDVLHDFWVPQFRAKMDIVPGMITYMWFTPTRAGTYEVLCAELCGVGHHTMRGTVVVDERADYERWLDSQRTYADILAGVEASTPADPQVALGQQLVQSNGCQACHSLDGSALIGPTWQGLWGRTETLDTGVEVVVDADYVRSSITSPNDQLVATFAPVMIAYEFTDEELDAIIAYLRESTSVPEEASLVETGEQIAQAQGCFACHSLDGSIGIGPTWQGLWGRTETLEDGSEVVVDEAYIRESILTPAAKIVDGFAPLMIPYPLDDDQLAALTAYAQTLTAPE